MESTEQLLYQRSLQLAQEAAIDEIMGSPVSALDKYKTAVGLLEQVSLDLDRAAAPLWQASHQRQQHLFSLDDDTHLSTKLFLRSPGLALEEPESPDNSWCVLL